MLAVIIVGLLIFPFSLYFVVKVVKIVIESERMLISARRFRELDKQYWEWRFRERNDRTKA